MLELVVSIAEQYDELKNEFITAKVQTLQLEHSLVSLSKWEAKWRKPFLSKEEKTVEQTIDYIRCMTITKNVSDDIYKYISNENIKIVHAYIEADMTATILPSDKKNGQKKIITSELIYYWMIALNIPSEYQKWHLSRLLTLVNVCNIENAPPKKNKVNMQEVMRRNNEINEARKKALNSNG